MESTAMINDTNITEQQQIAIMKKMSTSRLVELFVKIMGYTPYYTSNEDRQLLISMISGRINNLPAGFNVTELLGIMEQMGREEDQRRFSNSEVISMRAMSKSGETYAEISRIFGLSAKRTRDICLMKAYKHVADR